MFNQNLRQFLATYRLELKLIASNWGYWLLVTLWSAFIIITYKNDDLVSIRMMFNFVLGFIGLIGLFFAGIQASRSKRNKFDQLEVAFPTGSAVIFARWLGTLTALCGLLIAPIGVALVVPAFQIERGHLILMVFLCVLSSSFVTGLVWLIDSVLGIKRWMYPLFGVFWLACGSLPVLLTYEGMPIPGASLFNFIIMDVPSNSLWGTLIQGGAALWHRLFYVGVVALFVGVIHWRYVTKRFNHQPIMGMLISALGFGLVLVSGVSYTLKIASFNQMLVKDRALARELMTPINQLTDPFSLPYAVTRYDITFTHQEQPHFTAQMHIINRGETPLDQLKFSLYYQFDVTSANIPFTREGHQIIFDLPERLLPDDTLMIEITYQGALWIIEQQVGRPPEASDFIHPQGVSLSHEILWYPMAGIVSPRYLFYEPEIGIFSYTLLSQPAEFYLTVESDHDLTFVSNLMSMGDNRFMSAGTTWVNLIGAEDLITRTQNGMTLIATESSFDLIQPDIDAFYSPLIDYVHEHFSDIPSITLQVLDVSAPMRGTYPTTSEMIFLSLAPTRLYMLSDADYQYQFYAGQRFLLGLFGGQDSLLTNNIVHFLWIHYQADGDAQVMMSLFDQDGLAQRRSTGNPEFYAVYSALFDIYTTHGEARVFETLKAIRLDVDHVANLSLEVMIDWIQTHAEN